MDCNAQNLKTPRAAIRQGIVHEEANKKIRIQHAAGTQDVEALVGFKRDTKGRRIISGALDEERKPWMGIRSVELGR